MLRSVFDILIQCNKKVKEREERMINMDENDLFLFFKLPFINSYVVPDLVINYT